MAAAPAVRTFTAVLVATLLGVTAARAQAPAGPIFSATGPGASDYGSAEGYPVPPRGQPMGVMPQKFMVGLHSHYDLVRALRAVPTSAPPAPLKRSEPPIAPVYGYDGRIKTVGDYLADHPTTGLLIARGDTILYEHYRYARTDRDRLMSWSMAKTVVGLLVGIAIEEKAIRSIDDLVSAYVPELAGTEYGATPLRALLQMSSGIAFRETYQGDDDIPRLGADLFPPTGRGTMAAARQFNTRVAPPGTRFNYSSADTQVLGLVVARATGKSLSDYLSTRLWKKLGAEADAAWDVDPAGQEIALCCMVATLRDWARLGLMLANDGHWNGQQIVPKQWVIESTTAAPDSYLAPGKLSPILGYGYQVWLSAGERRRFSLIGIRGQSMLIDSVTKMVLVHTAVRLNAASGPSGVELAALWYAVLAQYGPR